MQGVLGAASLPVQSSGMPTYSRINPGSSDRIVSDTLVRQICFSSPGKSRGLGRLIEGTPRRLDVLECLWPAQRCLTMPNLNSSISARTFLRIALARLLAMKCSVVDYSRIRRFVNAFVSSEESWLMYLPTDCAACAVRRTKGSHESNQRNVVLLLLRTFYRP
jgi:hypothetical protein